MIKTGERGRDFAMWKRREVWIESGRSVVDQSKVWRLGGTWGGRVGRYLTGECYKQ